MMMLYFSGILRRDAGTPGASEISKRLSINSERLENKLRRHKEERNGRTHYLWSSIAFFHRAFSASSVPVDGQPRMTIRFSSWGSPESARTFDSRREISR